MSARNASVLVLVKGSDLSLFDLKDLHIFEYQVRADDFLLCGKRFSELPARRIPEIGG